MSEFMAQSAQIQDSHAILKAEALETNRGRSGNFRL